MNSTDIDFAARLLAYAWFLAIVAGIMYSLILVIVAWPHRACCGFWGAIVKAHSDLA